MTCDAVFGAGSENFGTITGTVTFQNGSANSGTVTGNAVFNGNAENKSGATITGNATFNDSSVNAGAVSGNASVALTATNTGTVSGTVTVVDPDIGTYNAWLAANIGVNTYTGVGSKNGQWAYNQAEYDSSSEALAAEEAVFQAWLGSNTGVHQYGGTGPHNSQWFYGSAPISLSPLNISSAPEYASDTFYYLGNVVTLGGNRYVCISQAQVDSNYSNPLTHSSDWVLLA